jgi:hypothetical protein
MTINYKFNKSSEARDCVVESVELFTEKYTQYKKLSLQTFSEVVDNVKKIETGYLIENSDGKGVCKQIESLFKIETKQFASQKELKDYINTIQEPIEFITESDIDQVLMKEWIGEWEYKKVTVNKLRSVKIKKELIDKFTGSGNKKLDHGIYCHRYFTTQRYFENLVMKDKYTIDGDLVQRQFFERYMIEENTKEKLGSPKLNSNWIFKIK